MCCDGVTIRRCLDRCIRQNTKKTPFNRRSISYAGCIAKTARLPYSTIYRNFSIFIHLLNSPYSLFPPPIGKLLCMGTSGTASFFLPSHIAHTSALLFEKPFLPLLSGKFFHTIPHLILNTSDRFSFEKSFQTHHNIPKIP